jgi:hypothetical protein
MMVEICHRCKRAGTCGDYQQYLQPSLFPNLEGPIRSRQKEIRRMKLPLPQKRNPQEQLPLKI